MVTGFLGPDVVPDGPRMRTVLIGLLVIFLVTPLAKHTAVGAPPEDPGKQALEILQEGGYQQEVPNLNAEGERPEDGDEETGNQQQDVTDAEGSEERFGAMVGGVLDLLLWVGVLVACAGALYVLVRVLAQGGQELEDEPESMDEAGVVEDQDIDRSGMEETLSNADELAREGRYTDAIRRMFMDATERIERDLDVSLSKSDTNHEYLERIPGTGDVQELCRKLVTAVDRFYYGGRPCDESDYRRCRTVWEKVQNRSGSAGSA